MSGKRAPEGADADVRARARAAEADRIARDVGAARTPWLHGLRQRTRWLKGFVQTWLVHMRSPRALWRELGPNGFVAFQVMVGGTILSARVHPWFYALVGFELLGGGSFLARPASLFGLPFWAIAWFDLVTGYLAAMALGFLAVRRRGLANLSWQVLLMPLYWLFISVAAYRALWQFATAPFKWEKTVHGDEHSAGVRPHRP